MLDLGLELDVGAVRRVLARVLDEARTARVDFRVVGTAAAQLQGVELDAGDIDLLFRDREDLDAFAAAVAQLPLRRGPLYIAESRQYFAELALDGVSVELSTVEWEGGSDAGECVGEGPWLHYRSVRCGRHDVPVVALELRLATEILRRREDRSAALIAHLREHGDRDLLNRALDAAGMAPGDRLATLAAVAS